MIGVEFRGPAAPVLKGLKEKGILAVKAGDHVLRLLPPLVVKRGEIRQLLGALDEVLGTGAGRCRQTEDARGHRSERPSRHRAGGERRWTRAARSLRFTPGLKESGRAWATRRAA